MVRPWWAWRGELVGRWRARRWGGERARGSSGGAESRLCGAGECAELACVAVERARGGERRSSRRRRRPHLVAPLCSLSLDLVKLQSAHNSLLCPSSQSGCRAARCKQPAARPRPPAPAPLSASRFHLVLRTGCGTRDAVRKAQHSRKWRDRRREETVAAVRGLADERTVSCPSRSRLALLSSARCLSF